MIQSVSCLNLIYKLLFFFFFNKPILINEFIRSMIDTTISMGFKKLGQFQFNWERETKEWA